MRLCSALGSIASVQQRRKPTHISQEAEVDSAKGEEIKGCVVQCRNKGSRGYESPCSHAEKALQGFSIIPSYLDTRLKSEGFYLRPRWVIRLKGPPEEDAHVPRPPPRRREEKQCSTRLHIHYSKINLH